jgi:hypothetical protein
MVARRRATSRSVGDGTGVKRGAPDSPGASHAVQDERVAAEKESTIATPYAGAFVEQYIVSALYRSTLTRTVQLGLGAFVVAVNGIVYLRVIRRSL